MDVDSGEVIEDLAVDCHTPERHLYRALPAGTTNIKTTLHYHSRTDDSDSDEDDEPYNTPCKALSLSIYPSVFELHSKKQSSNVMPKSNLSNRAMSAAEYKSTQFAWMAYGFNSGHLFSTVTSEKLPFHLVLAADYDAHGRALFRELWKCPTVLPSIHDLLNYVRSPTSFSLCGYALHSPRDMRGQSHPTFWRHQATIIIEARKRRGLHILFAHIHDATPAKLLKLFSNKLQSDGWLLTMVNVSFPDFGDAIDGNANILLGIHSAVCDAPKPLNVATPPFASGGRIDDFILKEFNKETYMVSWGRDTPFFASDDNQLKSA